MQKAIQEAKKMLDISMKGMQGESFLGNGKSMLYTGRAMALAELIERLEGIQQDDGWIPYSRRLTRNRTKNHDK